MSFFPLGGLRPSATQAATTHNYVSSIDLINNIHKPEIESQLTMSKGDQSLTGFMALNGGMNGISSIEYSHYEEDWLHETIQTTGNAIGTIGVAIAGMGDPLTHTVAAGDVLSIGAPSPANSPYIDNSLQEFILPRVNDYIQYPGGLQAMVIGSGVASGLAANEFSAQPTQAGVAIPALVVGEEIIIIGNAHGERTGQPEGRNSRVALYKNNLMICKSSNVVSGTEMAQQTWIEVKDAKGKTGYLWYFKAFDDMYRRSQNEMEMTMLLGQQITNTALAQTLPTTTISEGLIPFIENYGSNVGYSGVSGYTLADLDNTVLTLDKERGAKENTIWAGIELATSMDDAFIDLFQAGGVSYGAFSGDQEKAVNLEFKSFNRSGYSFHRKTYDAFNYKKILGAAGQKYPSFGMVIPADKTVEAKTGNRVASCRINYLQGKENGYSREMEEFLLGGANGVYNTDIDEVSVNYRSHRGFEGFAPNRFQTIFKS